jgi:hypothetical protein
VLQTYQLKKRHAIGAMFGAMQFLPKDVALATIAMVWRTSRVSDAPLNFVCALLRGYCGVTSASHLCTLRWVETE